ncbi:fasciclin domain-containing protein [Nostoc sp. 'Lobaria pulmonaria (5183) cyanobiont']|uniref:fasciclin domain-containing protein n=1 Tax=Nostoc sp. 'Lobaria pulmonaria (5183) cyanobiont' TaxID=1618022 RepID=UPI000CF35714|nr:fasciclin domain-containing protein [Nostoc sp. 'Lobaria pulmonaria (5183) cyanobiont']AVH70630.1 fasciclin domain-containing protein [Nostoc sp. 'Lobaria pulmonaria (5183) cyanobiont']
MPDIIDTAINAGSFNTLVTAITTAGLDTALKGDGPFTVFAPTDEAFSKLPSGAVEELLEDVIKLREVLEYHVVSGKINASELNQSQKLTTTQGKDINVSNGNNVKVNDAYIVTLDVEADNGVIHVIDNVLFPD